MAFALLVTDLILLLLAVILACLLADARDERDGLREERDQAIHARDAAYAQLHDTEQFLAVLHGSTFGDPR